MRSPNSSKTRRTAIGRSAEDAAAAWLEARGWVLLGRNVRVGHLEIDILARRGSLVSVVEVRTRGPGSFASALDSVDVHKRKNLRAAAARLWDEQLRHDPGIESVRFDVAAVTFGGDGQASVELFEAAFQ